jgi:FkbM family methyltransferase
VSFDPVSVDLADPHGWVAFWALYEAGGWDPDTRELVTRLLSPGDLFVDVGAWIGPVTLWAAQAGARVIALEPDPAAYAELSRRTAAYASVATWPMAVGLRSGTGWLTATPGGALGDSRSHMDPGGPGPADGATVAVRTLPEILSRDRPKFVKIDIEGGEVELMPELAPWLASRGAAVQVSCHGTLPDRESFNGFADVTWPTSPWGDVVAIP